MLNLATGYSDDNLHCDIIHRNTQEYSV